MFSNIEIYMLYFTCFVDITNKQGNSFMDTNIQNKVKDLLDKIPFGSYIF